MLQDLEGWEREGDVPVEIGDDDRCFASPDRFAEWARGRRSFRMECFHRGMRRETGLLLEPDGEPAELRRTRRQAKASLDDLV